MNAMITTFSKLQFQDKNRYFFLVLHLLKFSKAVAQIHFFAFSFEFNAQLFILYGNTIYIPAT